MGLYEKGERMLKFSILGILFIECLKFISKHI